jgi:uncharacterized membrane protein YciS (DUF1049 family)
MNLYDFWFGVGLVCGGLYIGLFWLVLSRDYSHYNRSHPKTEPTHECVGPPQLFHG